MAYKDFKNLPRKTASDKVLRDKAFDISKNPKHDGHQRDLDSMVYNSFDKKTSNTNKGTGIDSENKKLTKELYKPITRKFEKQKVHLSFIERALI